MKYNNPKAELWNALLAGLTCLFFASAVCAAAVPPPPTRLDSVVDTLHGVVIPDPYRWLEDQDSPETRDWIDAQNAYSHSLLDTISGRDKLRERFSQLLKMDQCWVRKFAGDTYLFSKRKAGDQFSSIYLRRGLTSADQLLIDPMTLSADMSVTAGIAGLTGDGLLMSYQLRHGGEDETTIKFKDLATITDYPDSLPKAMYFTTVLTEDKKGIYFAAATDNGPRIGYHAFGTDNSQDKLIFGDSYNKEWELGIDLSTDGRFLIAAFYKGSSGDQTDLYLKDASDPAAPFVTVVKDVASRFEPIPARDKLYIKTNHNAPNSRLMVADFTAPEFTNWKEVIPTSDIVLEDVKPAGGMLFAKYLDSAKSRVKVFTADGAFVRDLDLPALGMVGSLIGSWDTDQLFVTFGSFTYPWTQFRYDLKTWESSVFERVNIPLDPEKFVVKQVWFTSKDGTRVPMFVVHAKDMPLDGNRPVYMTGYGGFNQSMPPMFSQWAIVWMEHGGAYVLVSLRGGGEFGEKWHTSGMLDKKQNVFDDLYAGAEWLIANKYTNSSRLAVEGGSNGGLLVGAALTQRPDLFGAIVCTYPLLDMIRYDKFLSGKFWVAEYGSAEDSAQFRYLLKYSPYHNVKKGAKYPAVLFETGDADTRVAPLHARKMTALVQARTGSDKPVMLLYDTRAGHSGGRSYDKIIDGLVDQFSFLFWQFGMNR
jgi:prolyl oligopeptidase